MIVSGDEKDVAVVAKKKSTEERVELQINDATRVRLNLPKQLLLRAIANQVDLDKLVTTCLECLLDSPGGPIGVAINPAFYATQTINEDEVETRCLIRMNGEEVYSEIEDLNPDLPFYQ